MFFNNLTCPYCEKEIKEGFCCENHKDIQVLCCGGLDKDNNLFMSEIKMWNKDYYPDFIWINLEENIMTIYKDCNKVAQVDLDKSLTPENFEDKLKTYLIFL